MSMSLDVVVFYGFVVKESLSGVVYHATFGTPDYRDDRCGYDFFEDLTSGKILSWGSLCDEHESHEVYVAISDTQDSSYYSSHKLDASHMASYNVPQASLEALLHVSEVLKIDKPEFGWWAVPSHG